MQKKPCCFISCWTKSKYSVASICISLALIGISLWSVLFRLRSLGFKPCRLTVCLLWSLEAMQILAFAELRAAQRNGRRVAAVMPNGHKYPPGPQQTITDLFLNHWIVMSLNTISIKAQSRTDKIVTSGHRCSKCLRGKCWSRISLQLFTQLWSVGCEIHLLCSGNRSLCAIKLFSVGTVVWTLLTSSYIDFS